MGMRFTLALAMEQSVPVENGSILTGWCRFREGEHMNLVSRGEFV